MKKLILGSLMLLVIGVTAFASVEGTREKISNSIRNSYYGMQYGDDHHNGNRHHRDNCIGEFNR